MESQFQPSRSAVLLQIFENHLRLGRGQIGADAHMDEDGAPFGGGPFGRRTFRMTAVAVDGIKLGASQRPAGFSDGGGAGTGGGVAARTRSTTGGTGTHDERKQDRTNA